MSAIADALKLMGMENTKAIEAAETLFSGVSSCLSMVSTVEAVAKLLKLMDSDDNKELQKTLSRIEAQLNALIKQVIEEVRQSDELEKLRRVSDYLMNSRTAVDIALHYMTGPANPAYDIAQSYRDSHTSVLALADDSSFKQLTTTAVFFNMWLFGGNNDIYGITVQPVYYLMRPQDESWSYRYALPGLIEAIANHLVVIKVINPETYIQDHRGDLQMLAEKLWAIYNKIIAGIVVIDPPRNEIARVNDAGNAGNYYYSWWGYQPFAAPNPYYISTAEVTRPSDPNLILRPYGAVDTYSAVHNIDRYPHYKLEDQGFGVTDESYRRFYTKYHVRTLKKKMDIYRTVGLTSVWNTFAGLKRLLNEPIPEPTEVLNCWSIRTVANAVEPYGIFQKGPGNTIGLRCLMDALEAPSPVSVREMLDKGVNEGDWP